MRECLEARFLFSVLFGLTKGCNLIGPTFCQHSKHREVSQGILFA
jgi:hypothetical protein